MSDKPTQLSRLLAIMSRLRDPVHGCPWDRQQSFASIARYTIEEAYEVADAIARNNIADLREELGDLLLQVVFHAQIATDNNLFTFEDVAATIADKMEARHPHIFHSDANIATDDDHQHGRTDNTQPNEPGENWERLKEKERAAKGASSAMDGVLQACPALMRAQKLQKRAARDGFDWPDISGPSQKVHEEMGELAEATPANQEEEAGDFLFAAANLVRAYGIDPETALRKANAKFERRYRAMETLSQKTLRTLSAEEKEELWEAVKRSELGKPA